MEPSGEQVCYQLEGPKAYPLLPHQIANNFV